MVELLIVAGLFLTLLIGMALFVTPSSEYCLNCQQRVKASKGFSWTIFLLLLIFSLGVGAFLYVAYFFFKRKTCTICGGTNFGESHERHGQATDD
jgi:magnesium-transporting ATPase (P-type)